MKYYTFTQRQNYKKNYNKLQFTVTVEVKFTFFLGVRPCKIHG